MLEIFKELIKCDENLSLISKYRNNFSKEESHDDDSYLMKIKYFLENKEIAICIWINSQELYISPSSISSSSISPSSISPIDYLLLFSVLLEELNDYTMVYFSNSKKKHKNLLNKFCSSGLISIELVNKRFDLIVIEGNLEENILHEFPLFFFD